MPGVTDWVAEAVDLLRHDSVLSDWEIRRTTYDDQNSFSVLDLVSQVCWRCGPVVLVEKVQTKPTEILRSRLRFRSIVLIVNAADSTDIWNGLCDARKRFESGEPFLPRKLVLAILIVRKLIQGHYWGGKDKGYMYLADLPKGRGVSEEFADITAEVANMLLLNGLLIKKPSKRRPKYALNPARKDEVHAIADTTQFRNRVLYDNLAKDRNEVSARILDTNR